MATKIKITKLKYPEHCIRGTMSLPGVIMAEVVEAIKNQQQLDMWKQIFTVTFGNRGTAVHDDTMHYPNYEIRGNSRYSTWYHVRMKAIRAALKNSETK